MLQDLIALLAEYREEAARSGQDPADIVSVELQVEKFIKAIAA